MRDAFWLGDDERQTRELARTLARERIAPLAAQVDETESYPAEQLRLLGSQGLMGLYIPDAYGGAGLGALSFCLAVEEIAWACASTAVIYLVQYAAGYPLVSHGTDDQKRRYLPRLASGEITCALSISEPGAGSDVFSLTSRAEPTTGGYRPTGVKTLSTNAPLADVVLAFAYIERSAESKPKLLTGFLVPRATPGMSFGQPMSKM